MPKYRKQKGPGTYPIHCPNKRVSPLYRKGFRTRYRCECGQVFIRSKLKGRLTPDPAYKKPITSKEDWWKAERNWWE